MATGLENEKAQTYLINVVILEGRHYIWSNATTAVVVKIKNKKKSTAVRYGTDNPYYNEYFVFEFNTTLEALLEYRLSITVIQPKTIFKKRKILGSVEFDLFYIWLQPDHQFYHKWATLACPKTEETRIFRGYLKVDLHITSKGHAPRFPVNVQNDEIEGNLLIQEEGIIESHPAIFIFDVFKCINLSKYSNIAYEKLRKDSKDVNPSGYVEVIFAGKSMKTNVFYNQRNPVINQRLVIKDMIPTVCQRFKIRLYYINSQSKDDYLSYNMNLKLISNFKEDGFLPTFGPTFIHLYTKQNSVYGGSVLIGMSTEIKHFSLKGNYLVPREIPKSVLDGVSLPITKTYLFIIITEISLISKKYADKPLQFMLTHGNYETSFEESSFSSSFPLKRINSKYCYLKIEGKRPCLHLPAEWVDFRRKLFNTNILDKLANKLKRRVSHIENLLNEGKYSEINGLMDASIDDLHYSAKKYLDIVSRYNVDVDGTNLEKERMKMCTREMKKVVKTISETRSDANRKSDFKKLLKTIKILDRIKEEAQNIWPDVILWMVYNNKKIAGVQLSSKDIIYSAIEEECGTLNSVEHTLFLTRNRRNTPNNFACKIVAKFWLGLEQQRLYSLSAIPDGFSYEEDTVQPKYISSNESYTFQCRVHIFQGKIIPGFDVSGLVDTFVVVYVKDKWNKTRVKYSTLNPVWDETLIYRNITLYGSKEYIRSHPPDIMLEVFDQDKCKNDVIGRGIFKPVVKMKEDPYGPPLFPPKLTWHEIYFKDELCGEILSAFELLESSSDEIEETDSEPLLSKYVVDIPSNIKPTFKTYRIEVYFWGVRKLKQINTVHIKKPRIDILIQDQILSSDTITNANKNPNFSNCIKYSDINLPDKEEYCGPIRIKMYDSRYFGIYVFCGTYIAKIQPFIISLMTKSERENALTQIEIKSLDIKYQSRTNLSIDYEKSIENASVIAIKSQEDAKAPATPKMSFKYMLQILEEIIIFLKHCGIINENELETKTASEPPPVVNYENTEDYDWWTKFYASIRERPKVPDKALPIAQKYKLKVYQSELESQPEFQGFTDMLPSFEIFKGKRTGDEILDEDNVMGVFKGQIKVYQWPPEDESVEYVTSNGMAINDGGVFQTFPNNNILRYVLRVYCVQALNLRPLDILGRSDPYIVVKLGNQVINDKENYIKNQVLPVFGKCFEFNGAFPQDNSLIIEIWDYDQLTEDDLIGETVIDLENRFYTQYRANCGIPDTYQTSGYCQWRDYQRPKKILQNICFQNGLELPEYAESSVRIGPKVFEIDPNEVRIDPAENKQVLALNALRRWNEMSLVGFNLVPEHVETRSLYHPKIPGIEQGKLQMWVDILPFIDDRPLPNPVDITPRKPVAFELRVIIWNTQEVLLDEDDYFLGEKKSDIYVKGWLTSTDDAQSTDVHYRSLTGEGNFNWRFIFPFEYLSSENLIVIKKKHHKFSLSESELKVPCILNLQVWDNDTISADDFIGTMHLELAYMHKGAPSPEKCDLSVFDSNARKINLFKVKRTKGWWPFYNKDPGTNSTILAGKLEAELEILLSSDAIKLPAGLGRDEPQALKAPNRPDVSFSWFKNPLKALKFYFCSYGIRYLLIGLAFILIGAFFAAAIYALPGYTVKKILGA